MGEVLYCQKCGNEVGAEDEFCSKCRSPIGAPKYTRVHNRKNEEEDPYGYMIGGGVLVWLGSLLILQNLDILSGNFGGYFLIGIGVILTLRGVLAYHSPTTGSGYGFLVGGGVLVLIGAGITFNIQEWWAFLFIGLGLSIIYRGIVEQK